MDKPQLLALNNESLQKLKVITLNICNVSPGGNLIQGVLIYQISSLISLYLLVNLFSDRGFLILISYIAISYFFFNHHFAQINTFIMCIVYPKCQQQYKKERIQLLIENLKYHQADIVCLQEVNTVWGLTYYSDLIIQESKKIGYQYYAFSSKYPKFPCTFSVGGMMVLSKHYIKHSKFHTYKYHPFYEIPIVTRGYQHVQVQINSNIFHVLNIHTSSGNQILVQTLNINNKKKQIFSNHNKHGMIQFEQIMKTVKEICEDKNAKLILAGDFNLISEGQDYEKIKQKLDYFEVKDTFYAVNGKHESTFGVLDIKSKPIEILMTRKCDQGKQECLDYIFSNINCTSSIIDHFQNKQKNQMWQQVSDHSAIVSELNY